MSAFTSVNLLDKQLFDAVLEHDFNKVKIAITAGANPNSRADPCIGCTNTPLMYATDDVNITQILIEAGGDTSLKNQGGMTTLDLAREFNNHDTVQYLEQLALRKPTIVPPTPKTTFGKTRAAAAIRHVLDPTELNQLSINSIKRVFNNNVPDCTMPFSENTRVGLWIGIDSKMKQFKEVDIGLDTHTWSLTIDNLEPFVANSPHGLGLKLSRRDMLPQTAQTDNWGLFYVTVDNGKTWWNAREWKFYVAACFGVTIGKEKGRRRLGRDVAA
jgi:hypothetical protein